MLLLTVTKTSYNPIIREDFPSAPVDTDDDDNTDDYNDDEENEDENDEDKDDNDNSDDTPVNTR